MHLIETRRAQVLLATAALLCLLAAPVRAEDRPWEHARWSVLDAVYALAEADSSSGLRASMSPRDEKERRGFAFTPILRLSVKRNIALSIQGPLIAESAPGLSFELRF